MLCVLLRDLAKASTTSTRRSFSPAACAKQYSCTLNSEAPFLVGDLSILKHEMTPMWKVILLLACCGMASCFMVSDASKPQFGGGLQEFAFQHEFAKHKSYNHRHHCHARSSVPALSSASLLLQALSILNVLGCRNRS